MEKMCANCEFASPAFDEEGVLVCENSFSQNLLYVVDDDDSCCHFESGEDECDKNDDDLLPCPVCGSSMVDLCPCNWDDIYVSCLECGAETEVFKDKKKATAAWNKRSDVK